MLSSLAAFPVRLLGLFRAVVNALHQHNIPITVSSFNPASLRQVFPTSVDCLHYNALTKAMFPHLHRYPLISFSAAPANRAQLRSQTTHPLVRLWDKLLIWHRAILSTVTLPIELARQECRLKRKELEKIRDERAEALGSLSEMRLSLQDNFDIDTKRSYNAADLNIERYSPLIDTLQRKLDGKPVQLGVRPGSVERLLDLSIKVLPGHKQKNVSIFAEDNLKRPSNLVLVWPKLLLGPPLLLFGCKLLYTSRTSLQGIAKDAWNTTLGLWQGWLIDPLKDVLRTVRTGGEDSIIVQKGAVAADLAVSESSKRTSLLSLSNVFFSLSLVKSLERMALSLARDKLYYSSSQLENFSNAVRQGDLTPILRIYEEDIRTPVKSAISGTLLRSLFIQVQKAKVVIFVCLLAQVTQRSFRWILIKRSLGSTSC
jgi:nuclear-control-of-ATPase protein 2